MSQITISKNLIRERIFVVRKMQVMMDKDLAELYGVPLKRLNEQVKRNIKRFPERFMFQLSASELENLRSQIATTSLRSQNATIEMGRGKHRKYLPYVFTEQGVAIFSKRGCRT